MKKLSFLIFLIFSLFTYSQNFKFDYAIVSKSVDQNSTSRKAEFTNLYDSSKKQHLYIRMIDADLRGRIMDEEKGFIHSFKANQEKDFLTFQYLYSEKINKDKNVVINDVIEISKIDSLQYQVIGYRNEKRKSRRFTAIITIEKSDLDYLHLGIDHAKNEFIGEEFRKLLDPDSTYKIIEMRLKYSTGAEYKITFQYQKIDLDFSVPSKLILTEN